MPQPKQVRVGDGIMVADEETGLSVAAKITGVKFDVIPRSSVSMGPDRPPMLMSLGPGISFTLTGTCYSPITQPEEPNMGSTDPRGENPFVNESGPDRPAHESWKIGQEVWVKGHYLGKNHNDSRLVVRLLHQPTYEHQYVHPEVVVARQGDEVPEEYNLGTQRMSHKARVDKLEDVVANLILTLDLVADSYAANGQPQLGTNLRRVIARARAESGLES